MFLVSRVILEKNESIGVYSHLDLAKEACEKDYSNKKANKATKGIVYLIENFELDTYDEVAPHVLYDYVPSPNSNTWSLAIIERISSI